MRALQLVEWQRPPELREVPVPEPGPGQVLVRIGGAGACHSDLHIMEEPEPADSAGVLPFTLGHENAGWVETVGAGVTGFAPGDAVIVYGPWGCGVCANCRQGRENYCLRTSGLGGGLGSHDGGMAEYLLVPAARLLVPLGDLDPREAAPLSDAGLTSYHVVKRSLHLLGAGSTAVVIGAGGLGQMAIQILRALSAATTVVAVDTGPDKLETAGRLGADEALPAGDQAVARIKDMTRGQGAELVLDMVGVDPTLRMASQVAGILGDLTIVGLGGGALPVQFASPPHECSVAVPYWGYVTELMEVITLAQQQKIKTLVEYFPLERAGEAYQLMHDGKIKGRAVITPHA
ncbi:NAD(P)-dependent alcohol dehydrogenase [Streptomyces sp. NPDC004286]|uniref:NAD(P)-dependent alcohol dehydrogenase n=1 Tax=Streptomyces sp. NPDC004286 TaxID=3364696 RepID=UPI00369DEA10